MNGTDTKTKLLRALSQQTLVEILYLNANALDIVLTKPPRHVLTELAKRVLSFVPGLSCTILTFRNDSCVDFQIQAHVSSGDRDDVASDQPCPFVALPPAITAHIHGMRGASSILIGDMARQLARGLSNVPSVFRFSFSEAVGRYLIVPFLDRKKVSVVGILAIAKEQDRTVARSTSLQPSDFTARILADTIELVIEKMSFMGACQEIVTELHATKTLDPLLERAVKLVGADRGDFALWVESRGDLIITSIYGGTMPTTVPVGYPAPTPGFIRACWNDRVVPFKLCRDVAKELEYHIAHPDTRSGLAVRFQKSGHQIGVLNVESFKPNWFDEQDINVLQVLAAGSVTVIEANELSKSLQASNELYDSLVNSIPQYIVRKDVKGKFVFVNESYCRLLDLPLDAIKGKTDFDFYPKELARKYREDDRKVLASKDGILQQEEVHEVSGRERMVVHVTKVAIRDADDCPVGIQCIFEDITDQKRTREQLQSLVASQKNAFEDLAHQLKGPLTQAKLQAEHALSAPAPDQARAELMVVASLCRKALRVTRRAIAPYWVIWYE